MYNWLLGDLGIDTEYERDLLYYRPYLSFYKENLETYRTYDQIPEELDRINQNRLSDVLERYLKIIDDFMEIREKLLQKSVINKDDKFTRFREAIRDDDIERIHAMIMYDKSPYYVDWKPAYTIVAHILKSLDVQLRFLMDRFAHQITDEKELSQIKEAEDRRIRAMINMSHEISSITAHVNEPTYSEDDIDFHDEDHFGNPSAYRSSHFDLMYELDDMKHLNKVLGNHVYFHETIADVSFINSARCDALDELVDLLNIYIDYRVSLVSKNLEIMAKQIFDNRIAHETMAIALESYNDRLGGFLVVVKSLENYSYDKQHFLNDKQYYLQQKRVVADMPVLSYLTDAVYDDNAEEIESYQSILIDGIEKNRGEYKDSNAEMYSFYEEEVEIYKAYINFMLDAEEARVLYLAAEHISQLSSFNYIDFMDWLNIRKREAEEEEEVH